MFLLNLQSIFQFVRLETVLEKLIDIREQALEKNAVYEDEVHKQMEGVKVVTQYNQKTYILENVHFDMTTESLFELSASGDEGFKVSYYDYFTKRYRLDITQVKQPMVRARSTLKLTGESKSVYLVPELCYIVGASELMWLRKVTSKEIRRVLRVDAPIMIQRMESFIKMLEENESPKEILNSWGFELERRPQKHNGYKLDPGYIIMG